MKQEVIEIDEIKIIVKEIKVKTARKIMSNVIEVLQGEVDVEKLINDKYDLLVDIANDFIIMPDGTSIDDLTYSDIKLKLFPVFKKVNESFLDDLIMVAGLSDLNLNQMKKSSEDSTKPLPT